MYTFGKTPVLHDIPYVDLVAEVPTVGWQPIPTTTAPGGALTAATTTWPTGNATIRQRVMAARRGHPYAHRAIGPHLLTAYFVQGGAGRQHDDLELAAVLQGNLPGHDEVGHDDLQGASARGRRIDRRRVAPVVVHVRLGPRRVARWQLGQCYDGVAVDGDVEHEARGRRRRRGCTRLPPAFDDPAISV